MIESAVNTFDATANAVLKVMDSISDTTLNKALEFTSNYEENIMQVNSCLKQNLEELINLNENFVNDTTHPCHLDIRECSQFGYDVHCSYLRYSNALDEIEKSFLNLYADMKNIDDRLVAFNQVFMKNVNGCFVSSLPHSAAKHDDHYNKIVRLFRTGFQGFRSPYVIPVYAAKFETPTVTMKATTAFNGTKVGEISIQSGEKVEAITTSYADWMKIRTANGNEGFVPVNILEPVR
ncbi:Variant SH3 domain containing protein [Trichomonas vaginalis G3]|uniref:Variant SH3 domain containing protein n=1 Tax=Trichomonas vaginalis (strain ATCC PRA-98 / G3) TaxID=412133 RepID=A2ETK8_TRIV3|nr:SH3-domain family [Trichomonas vaginalis G3]EAY03976.1 Variant SH3 domain containing protein [Trichomonas vaginalis G3]KAI5534890.1 SH3-domain family [Trichomonas vaginalis G3]|eukprot:XP_001316199.1 Variant SH3 domain containing protein [Trichomonas vaginalis G3]